MKKLSKLWVMVSLLVIIVLSILTNASLIQIVAAICGIIYVFGTVFENKYGQLFGVINSGLYGIILFTSGVYGTAIYDFVYCAPMQIYTFFTWGKDRTGKNKLNISRFSMLTRIFMTVAIAIIIAIYCVIATRLNVQFALVDGISIILGVVGLYLTSRKKIEQWYVFIISNIAMLSLWGIKCMENISNTPMLLMWIIYLINNIYGLYTWTKKMNKLEAKI